MNSWKSGVNHLFLDCPGQSVFCLYRNKKKQWNGNYFRCLVYMETTHLIVCLGQWFTVLRWRPIKLFFKPKVIKVTTVRSYLIWLRKTFMCLPQLYALFSPWTLLFLFINVIFSTWRQRWWTNMQPVFYCFRKQLLDLNGRLDKHFRSFIYPSMKKMFWSFIVTFNCFQMTPWGHNLPSNSTPCHGAHWFFHYSWHLP